MEKEAGLSQKSADLAFGEKISVIKCFSRNEAV
jgi:hypothetical protein